MVLVLWADIGARLIYIIQRPNKIISAIIIVYLSYLVANMAKNVGNEQQGIAEDNLKDGRQSEI